MTPYLILFRIILANVYRGLREGILPDAHLVVVAVPGIPLTSNALIPKFLPMPIPMPIIIGNADAITDTYLKPKFSIETRILSRFQNFNQIKWRLNRIFFIIKRNWRDSEEEKESPSNVCSQK